MIRVATSYCDVQLRFNPHTFLEFQMNKRTHLVMIALLTSALIGCKDVHMHEPGDDHDAITTVTVRIVDKSDTTKVITAVWEDLDGIGGANPNRIDTIKIEKARVYACSVTLQNHSAHPPVDLTEDIKSELDNHQFFYDIANGSGQIVITDSDSRGLPVGLNFTLTTPMDASAVPGSLTMSLYHFENSADKTGSNRGNETDVEVAFPLIAR